MKNKVMIIGCDFGTGIATAIEMVLKASEDIPVLIAVVPEELINQKSYKGNLFVIASTDFNVLSFFDGMSCGQLALQKIGIEVTNYFACEIDKYASKVAKHNFPNTIELGDVSKVYAKDLPKIDLFIGGSPCQGFSFAGKQLNFEDPRSKLFFEFVRMLNEIRETNPDVLFLLENVKMKKEFQDIITQHLGVEPVEINSNLVSAQNRKRLYWTNITELPQPKDREIFLKDIVEHGVPLKQKSQTILATLYKENAKSMIKRQKTGLLIKEFNVNPSGNGMNGWVYSINGKAPTVTTNKGEGSKIGFGEGYYRKLTPIECERLQNVPDNYTNQVSNSQRYKMLGNGWTIDVISHIFSSIKQKCSYENAS